MDTTFNNKVIWITGASGGIGKALAIQFAEKGALLVLSARRENELNDVKAQCADSEKHLVLPLDLADSSNFEALTKTVIGKFGKLDILVNNGGISQRGNVADTSMEVNRKVMNVNYFGTVALTKAVLPYFKAQKSGKFVVISSIAGKFGFYLRSAYSAAKHALHGFFESLRLEEEDNGVTVTIVCPGQIQTDISVNALTGSGEKNGQMDNNQANGMPVEKCATDIIKAITNNKEEVLVGGKETFAVTIKRFSPKLFGKIIRKQSAT